MRRIVVILTLLSSLGLVGSFNVAVAEAPANDAFLDTWARTDRPVVEGQVSRTWMWGPEAFTGALQEPYAESPGGMRAVQYFDKSRMEITDPNADSGSTWYVTNGLLVVEMITGRMQSGDASFEPHAPAAINVAGDASDPEGPTYATFASVLDAPPLAVGEVIPHYIDRAGNVIAGPNILVYSVTVAVTDEVTNHSIAAPFWEFMNATGPVYENGAVIDARLFENPYFATGRPITEAYWAVVEVGGTPTTVLIQCFERRCLTYTPENDPSWQVEAGNVGQHYHAWRYGAAGEPDPRLFDVALQPLNGSGVTGSASLTLEGGSLRVFISAKGAEAAQTHVQHIHGFDDGSEATCPAPEADVNGDGFVDLAEGLPAYGPVLMPLEPAPTANAEGAYSSSLEIVVENPATINLTNRVVVLHGMTADIEGDEIEGESYLPLLPVACGELTEVTEPSTFEAELSGGQEVPPVDTAATGVATFRVLEGVESADDLDHIDFTLNVQNIENATAAYIHIGRPGGNSLPAVFLWQADGEPFSGSGVLAEGTITSENVFGIALMDKTFAVLVREMLLGNAYVNVYTEAHPLDPGVQTPQPGEIRGQIELVD